MYARVGEVSVEPSWEEALHTFEAARSQIAMVGMLEERIGALADQAVGVKAVVYTIGPRGGTPNDDGFVNSVARIDGLIDCLHASVERYCDVQRRLVNVATSLADPLEADLLVALYAQGVSQRDYAEHHMVDRATVSRRKVMAIDHARLSPCMPALILEVEGVERTLAAA